MPNTYRDDEFDLDTLLHPAQAFEHPMRVVNDPDLTLRKSAPFSLRGPRTPVR